MPRKAKIVQFPTPAPDATQEATPSVGPVGESLGATIDEQIAKAKAVVEQWGQAYADKGLQIDYAGSVVPRSAELLLKSLIEEGVVDRKAMTLRQLVIQSWLLNAEFQVRATMSIPQSLQVPQQGLIVPRHARRKSTND